MSSRHQARAAARQPVMGTAARSLPGDPTPAEVIERLIRVDHAGEYGARRIYRGQLAVLKPGTEQYEQIRHMAEQEEAHLAHFEQLIGARRVRPTALYPLWHVAGYALGAATALMGVKAAMACTIAVEEVIVEHYARQAAKLGPEEAELKEACERFAADEDEHRATAVGAGGESAPGYRALASVIKAGSRAAIFLSERI